MVEKLIEIFGNPLVGVGGIIAAALMFYTAKNPKQFFWVLSVFAVLVSITPPTILDRSNYIGLWGPLESIRNGNRYFAVVAGLLMLVAVRVSASGKMTALPPSILALIAIHAIILMKNLVDYFDTLYVVLLFSAFFVVVLVYWNFIGTSTSVSQLLSNYFLLMAGTGFTFFLINGLQFGVNRAATSIVGGRFHGITNNPQMFVISIAPFLPLALYYRKVTQSFLLKVILSAAFLISIYWCYLTGSRLALVLIVVGILVYFQFGFTELIGVTLTFAIAMTVLQVFNIDLTVSGDSRVFTLSDTRTTVWENQMRLFLENPLFGQRFIGSRVTFGESTWLGAAAGLGIVGLLPTLIVGYRALKLSKLLWAGNVPFENASQKKVILAIVAVSLVGTIFEAYLFGVLTMPMIVFLVTMMTLERLSVLHSLPNWHSSGSRDPFYASTRSVRQPAFRPRG